MPGLSPTFWWDLDTVHASYVRSDSAKGTEHQVYLMGGFARLKDMSPEGLLLTACHEMGHGIGGNPKKTPASPHDIGSTTEGQADYFATKTCLPIALRYLKIKSSFTVKPIYQKLCTLQTQHSQNDCHRLFFALESDISFYKFLGSTVKLEAFSSHIQRSLNLNPTYYPDAQCRLDTSIHGILGLERPECWFPGGERNGALRD